MRPSTRALTVVLAGLLLAACGTPPHAAPAHAALSLTEQDGGRTVTVTVGAKVEIQLTDWYGVPGTSLTWRAVSTVPTVLAPVSTRLDPPVPANRLPRGTYHYRVQFRAARAGRAEISAQGLRTCEAMSPAFCQSTALVVTVVVQS